MDVDKVWDWVKCMRGLVRVNEVVKEEVGKGVKVIFEGVGLLFVGWD